MRRVVEAVLWPDKKKPWWCGGGSRGFMGLGGLGVELGFDNDDVGFKANFKELDDLSTMTTDFDGPAQRSAKRKSKNQFMGIRQRSRARWGPEIRDPIKGVRLWLGTFNSAEEDARAYDVEARRIHGKKAKINFPEEPKLPQKSRAPPASPKVPKPSAAQEHSFIPAFNNLVNQNAFVYPSAHFASKQQLVQPENVPFVPPMSTIAPVEAPVMNMYSDRGSNSFGFSKLGWKYHTKTPDISSIAPISTIAEGAEPVLVENNTYNSLVPPVMENNVVNFEPWMRYLMDDSVDEMIDSLLNFDVPRDVVSNRTFGASMPCPSVANFSEGSKPCISGQRE
ncbi:unnamed protein product [Triticum turgidum subsp. durum]|uniref:AP2/ERF domain-containing protein n=1 Tax=Triticum turgidum subsp. durum TaxID=4567 RepID=A0A9R1BFR3_TRITD|nr:unnamed protein product [Triticum turgidum subsp. durum]